MIIPKEIAQHILERSKDDIIEVISQFGELKKSGASYITNCPKCGSMASLNINPTKGIFKCFKCNQVAGKRPIDYLMSGQDMSYPDALKYLADHYSILGDWNPQPVKTKPAVKEKKSSFCARMLKESGLTKEDVMVNAIERTDYKTILRQPTFIAGSIDEHGDIDPNGDDAIIKYFDLDGNPVMYTPKDNMSRTAAKPREYYRVRYQYPEEHKDKSGRAAKYRSPYSSSSYIYIPEKVRSLYRNRKPIDRLFIQEGEKKAEKASKHGIISLGVAGIQNIGLNGKLPEEVAMIVETCQVREVVFLLDSDCFDLTSHIKVNDPIERRPKNFFFAVKNYKEYFNVLKNRGLYVEIYFGHVNQNHAGDKGIDDLLANTLAGREQELNEDIEATINMKDMQGKYVHLYKITTATDSKIQEIWALHSVKSFVERYKDILTDLPEFTFGRHKWKIGDNGELESAQPLEPNEMFWQEKKRVDKAGNVTDTSYEFRYAKCFNFLENRGFGRYRRLDGSYDFVQIRDNIVKNVTHLDVRDFLTEFTKEQTSEDILEMIYRGGPQYLGPDKLNNLQYVAPVLEKPQRGSQQLYFDECFWIITPKGITQKKYDALHHNIWEDQKKEFKATVLPNLINVTQNDSGEFFYTLTELGRKCNFLRFLENASNFCWRKEKIAADGAAIDITPEEKKEDIQHLIAKLCAIGFLICSVKDRSIAKAVVGVDGKQSEVGVSNGRTGKSLVGELLKRVINTQYINGKIADINKDPFIWDEVTAKTRLVFMDDVRRDFNLEMLFANITGDWAVNYKGGRRCTIEFKDSPKIYLTTNHMLSGEGSSFLDRQWIIAFSDYYNDEHKPADDFGCMFFDEWDYEQWNLTWNLVAQCIMLYFRFGCVESPGERVEMRRLRQEISEEFIMWADEYFSDDKRRNSRIPRKDMYEDLIKVIGEVKRKFYTPVNFKSRLKKYCKWKGYLYNPHRYDSITGQPAYFDRDGKPLDDDKSGGIEYFMVADPDYFANNKNIFSDPIDL